MIYRHHYCPLRFSLCDFYQSTFTHCKLPQGIAGLPGPIGLDGVPGVPGQRGEKVRVRFLHQIPGCYSFHQPADCSQLVLKGEEGFGIQGVQGPRGEPGEKVHRNKKNIEIIQSKLREILVSLQHTLQVKSVKVALLFAV